jgi:hypothetical protein
MGRRNVLPGPWGIFGEAFLSLAICFRPKSRELVCPGITGATLSGGAWHYHSTWNVGGGDHMYNSITRSWGIEGKDLRNVTFGNYFPSTFGGNFELGPGSTVQQFENIQAISVGMGVTYIMKLSEETAEACP